MKVKKLSTKGMSREDWLEARRKTIGGSEAAAIVGLSPYTSPYEVWADKLGKIPPKEDNEAMRQGRDLEEYVAKRFCEETGKKVRRENAILYNEDIPFAHANVDRLIVGEEAGLECKTTSVLNLRKYANGEYPANYYVQCQHYMMVTGYSKWYLAVLILGKDFKVFEIARNDEDIAALRGKETEFYGYVTSQTPPPVDGSESCTNTIGAIYQGNSEIGELDLTPLRRALERRDELVEKINELTAEKTEIENSIKSAMGDCEKARCDGYRVSWAASQRRTFDSKKFVKENPNVDVEPYYKTSEVRTFRITADK